MCGEGLSDVEVAACPAVTACCTWELIGRLVAGPMFGV
jgi:hypothetical protein